MKNKERIAILESEISRLKVANRNNIYRLEAIEGKLGIEVPRPARSAVVDAMLNRLIAKVIQRNSELNSSEIPNTCEAVKPDFIPDWKDAPEDAVCVAMDGNGDWFWWRHKPTSDLNEKGRWNTMSVLKEDGFENGLTETDWFADSATNADLLPPDYWKSTLMMRPESISDAPDYSHLLPDGYEFCQEADAEKWVKVEMLGLDAEAKLGFVQSSTINMIDGRIKSYRPIRPIQYKVTTHEIVTAVPDPYQPDWSKAPEGTVAHVYDQNRFGRFYYVNIDGVLIIYGYRDSYHLLPADLDWKQSLRVKPN
jgi:hypothetical protein